MYPRSASRILDHPRQPGNDFHCNSQTFEKQCAAHSPPQSFSRGMAKRLPISFLLGEWALLQVESLGTQYTGVGIVLFRSQKPCLLP
jgi:hypothetical protein